MKKSNIILPILALLLMLFTLPTIAPAPATTGWKPSYTTQVGCGEFDSGKMQATVTDPGKLAQFGLSAQKGDQIKIKVIGNNAFKLLNVRTGKAVEIVEVKGVLKKVSS